MDTPRPSPRTNRTRHLPKVGLVENDPRILIGSNAEAGPNSGTPVDRSPRLNKVCGEECAAWHFFGEDCGCLP